PLVGVNRREVVEAGAFHRFLGVDAVDGQHAQQGVVALVFLRRPHLPQHHVARAQLEATNLRGRHVHVFRAGRVAGHSQEPVAVGQYFEYALAEEKAFFFRLFAQDLHDEGFLAHLAVTVDFQLARDLVQLSRTLRLQLGQRHAEFLLEPTESPLAFHGVDGTEGTRAYIQGYLRVSQNSTNSRIKSAQAASPRTLFRCRGINSCRLLPVWGKMRRHYSRLSRASCVQSLPG